MAANASPDTVLRLAHRTFSAFEAALLQQADVFEATHLGIRVDLHDYDFPVLHELMVDGDGL